MGRGNEESEIKEAPHFLRRQVNMAKDSTTKKRAKADKEGKKKPAKAKRKKKEKTWDGKIIDSDGDEVVTFSENERSMRALSDLVANKIFERIGNESLFRDSDLSSLNLDGINLHEKRLDTDNYGEVLDAASFRRAKMKGTSIENAVVPETDFSSINGKGSSFKGSNIRRANFIRARLRGANLENSDAKGAFFAQADLRDSNLCGANLEHTALWFADLRGADLRDSNLCGADLRGADLRGADLRGANTKGIKLDGARTKGAYGI